MPATDVRNSGAIPQSFLHALERRNPFGNQMRRIAGPEETLGSLKQITIMFMPAYARASFESGLNSWLIHHYRGDDLISSRNKDRAVLDSQGHRLLVRQREFLRGGIISDIASSRLGGKPFTDITLNSSR